MKFKIDEKRVYATGHSNGGGFTYLLWTCRPDAFAALVHEFVRSVRRQPGQVA